MHAGSALSSLIAQSFKAFALKQQHYIGLQHRHACAPSANFVMRVVFKNEVAASDRALPCEWSSESKMKLMQATAHCQVIAR